MKTLIIIRGAPGSGKSTLALAIREQAYVFLDTWSVAICEADNFFMVNGAYKYVPHLVPAAHEWCQRQVQAVMKEAFPMIIVSNTSTVRSRLQPYFDLAKEHGYQVQQIVCFADFGSVHNVPKDTVDKMKEQLRNSLILELHNKEL